MCICICTCLPARGDPLKQYKFNMSLTNQDKSILFADLKSLDSSTYEWVYGLVGRCVGGLMDGSFF